MSIKQLALAKRYSAVAIDNTIIIHAQGETPSNQVAIWLEQNPKPIPPVHTLYWVPGPLQVISPFSIQQSFQVQSIPRSITVVDLAGPHQVQVRVLSLMPPTGLAEAADAGLLPLADTSWELVEFRIGRRQDPVIPGTRVTLNFSETSASGSGGCNAYGGSYLTAKDRIDIGPIVHTEMYCPEPAGVMEQERRFFQGLEAAERFTTDGKNLELLWAGTEMAMRFKSVKK